MTDVAHNGAEASAPDVSGGTVLVFLNEVAGGRKLLNQVRERIEAGAERIAIAAPQNQPVAGQIVDRAELADAARSRVEVTQSVFAEFGIEAEGSVMDPDPLLALDDAIRAYEPAEVLLSCLTESRYGLMRRDLVEWAQGTFEVPITHVPVRIDDDAIRWDVTHTLVVATQTVASAPTSSAASSRAPRRARTATPSSARARGSSRARRSASASPAPSPRCTARTSTRPASR